MARTISNSDDVIDSRDVIARIEELQDERDSLVYDVEQADEAVQDAEEGEEGEKEDAEQEADKARSALAEWDEENEAELNALRALQDEAEGYAPDWQHGATLIRDSYFVEYAEELCKDIGDLPKDIPHYIEIDWRATADNIRQDYTSVEFDGVTYWVR